MRILYVSQYFPPEMGAPAARVYELSREWTRSGHDVMVLTAFANHPTGVKAPGDQGVISRSETVDGIHIQRVYIRAAPNKGSFKRMMSYASFAVSAALLGVQKARRFRPDVVIATSPQLLCGLAGHHISRSLGVPFVFEVRDLWPESILAVEAMNENLLLMSLKSVASLLYRSSDMIVTVGNGYRSMIHKLYTVPLEKMHVVPNGIDPEVFSPIPPAFSVRSRYAWDGRFVVLYAGTLGMAHGLNSVLETARQTQDDRDFLFVFVGEGAEKAKLRQTASDWGLANVQFIDQQPKSEMARFYAACDVGLVSLRKTPLFQEVLPSKIFEYMAMERPILITVDGQARSVVEDAGAGRFVPPEDPSALAAALRSLKGRHDILRDMGGNGRRYVLEHFNRRKQAADYIDLLRALGTR